jgi:hypothetical protein
MNLQESETESVESSESEIEDTEVGDDTMQLINDEFKEVKKKLDYENNSEVCVSFSTPKQDAARQILGEI